MLLGVSTILFGGSGDIRFEDIDTVKKAGFDLLEISPYHNVSVELMKFIKSMDMKIYSIHADYLDTDASSLDEDIRLKTLRIFKETILTAKMLDARIAVMHPGKWYPGDDIKDECLKRCVGTFSELAAFADESGIKIALENLPPGFICDNVADLFKVLHQTRSGIVNKGKVGICLDTGHANISNNLEMYLHEFGSDIFSMHIHDNHGDTGRDKTYAEDDIHLVPGSGNVDWRSFFEKLGQLKYNNALIFELIHQYNSGEGMLKMLTGVKEFVKYYEDLS